MPQQNLNTESAEVRRIVTGSGTKSDKARQLAALGSPISEIARLLDMSPGHARQAIQGLGSRSAGTRTASTTNTRASRSSRQAATTPPNTNASSTEIRRIVAGSGTKSEKARQLAALNVPIAEIARLLGMSAGHAQQAVRGRGTLSTSTNSRSSNQRRTAATPQTAANPVQVSTPVPASASRNRAYTIELENHRGFRRKFGVEIECFVPNSVSQSQMIREINESTSVSFKIHRDGSIHAPLNFSGMELVSPVLNGISGLKALQKACEILNSKGAQVNKSCGFHVHFDAQDFKVKDWKNIVGNYAILEKDIDSFLAPSRRGNTNGYTKSLIKEGDSFKTLLTALKAETLPELRSNTRINDRYHKVNLYTYIKNHNTVEFRQHHGTVEFHKMAAWILFLDDLVRFSEYTVATVGGDEALKRFVNPDVMSHIEFRRRSFIGES